jgi:hypothetical protein
MIIQMREKTGSSLARLAANQKFLIHKNKGCATAISASARAHIVGKLSGVCADFYGLAGDENFL